MSVNCSSIWAGQRLDSIDRKYWTRPVVVLMADTLTTRQPPNRTTPFHEWQPLPPPTVRRQLGWPHTQDPHLSSHWMNNVPLLFPSPIASAFFCKSLPPTHKHWSSATQFCQHLIVFIYRNVKSSFILSSNTTKNPLIRTLLYEWSQSFISLTVYLVSFWMKDNATENYSNLQMFSWVSLKSLIFTTKKKIYFMKEIDL